MGTSNGKYDNKYTNKYTRIPYNLNTDLLCINVDPYLKF